MSSGETNLQHKWVQACDPGMENGEGSKEDTELGMKNHPQKWNKYHSEKGIAHIPYILSMEDTTDPWAKFPDWAMLKVQKILRDIMMDGNLEGQNVLKGTYNELKWRSATLDKSLIINKEILEDKIRWRHNNHEMTPGLMEASFQQTGSWGADGSMMAETWAVLVEIWFNDNDVHRMEETPMCEDIQGHDRAKEKGKDMAIANQK